MFKKIKEFLYPKQDEVFNWDDVDTRTEEKNKKTFVGNSAQYQEYISYNFNGSGVPVSVKNVDLTSISQNNFCSG